MSKLCHRCINATVENVLVNNNAAANACSESNHYRMLRTLCRTAKCLAESRRICIVCNVNLLDSKAGAKLRRNGEVVKSEIECRFYNAALYVNRAWGCNANIFNLTLVNIVIFKKTLNKSCHIVHNMSRAARNLGLNRALCNHIHITVANTDSDISATKVNSNSKHKKILSM